MNLRFFRSRGSRLRRDKRQVYPAGGGAVEAAGHPANNAGVSTRWRARLHCGGMGMPPSSECEEHGWPGNGGRHSYGAARSGTLRT